MNEVCAGKGWLLWLRCVMRVLLTNDDGIHAPGIVSLFEAITGLGEAGEPFEGGLRLPRDFAQPGGGSGGDEQIELVPMAPLTVQSATGHGVTFHQPLMTSDVQVNERMAGIAIDGRPADCVKLAVSTIWQERFGQGSQPDLLISGMNAGANCGVNVIYSGTVAAAIEGAFLGVPAIAVSLLLGRSEPNFAAAAAIARRAIERVVKTGLLSAHRCVNINLPVVLEDGAMPEMVVAPMNTHGLVDQYEKRQSPGGDVYYWSAGNGLEFQEINEYSDVHGLFNGVITVTPLTYDLTDHAAMDSWHRAIER